MFIAFKKSSLLIWMEIPLSIGKIKDRWQTRREEERRKCEGVYLPQLIQVCKRYIVLFSILIGKYIFFSLKTVTGRLKLQISVFFFFIYFYQLEANYFTILQWFLSYIDMNQPWSYMYSPSRSPLPLPSPPYSSGSSQCTRPEHLSHASNLGW